MLLIYFYFFTWASSSILIYNWATPVHFPIHFSFIIRPISLSLSLSLSIYLSISLRVCVCVCVLLPQKYFSFMPLLFHCSLVDLSSYLGNNLQQNQLTIITNYITLRNGNVVFYSDIIVFIICTFILSSCVNVLSVLVGCVVFRLLLLSV